MAQAISIVQKFPDCQQAGGSGVIEDLRDTLPGSGTAHEGKLGSVDERL